MHVFSRCVLAIAIASVPSVLHAQGQFQWVSPNANQHFTNPSITIQWRGCTNFAVSNSYTTLNGANVTHTKTATSGCAGYSKKWLHTATVTLVPGANTISGEIEDASGGGGGTRTVYYDAPVASVVVTNNGASSLEVGQTTTLTARTYAAGGIEIAGRSVTWEGTNVGVSPASGSSPATTTATAQAVGVGSVRALSQGVYSSDSPVTVLPTPAISVTPVGGTASVIIGNSSSSVFTVQNTGNGGMTATFSHSCGSGLTSCSRSANTQYLAPGASTTVTVYYTGSTLGSTQASLTASYQEYASTQHTGYYNVTVTPIPVASVVVTNNGGSTLVVGETTTLTARTYAAGGAELTGRTITWEPTYVSLSSGSTSPSTVTATGQTAGAGGVRALSEGVYSTVSNLTVLGSVGSVSVSTSGLNPRGTIERADCLAIAAGRNSAYECGDLRIIHPLPATVTMGKARAPTLVFNSRHATPSAWLAANVNYSVPGGSPVPTQLQATVTIPGQANTTKTFPWKPECANQSCRIVVPVQSTQVTGVYLASIQVQVLSGSVVYAESPVVSDTVVIVNRSKSPFGAGWWLQGLETLVHASSTTELWVGGDGSTRIYTKTGVDSVYVVTPAYDRPDTLVRLTNTNWRRLLGDGAYVELDNAGRHLKTVSSLGATTNFSYKTDPGTPLDSITLPVPPGSGQSRAYKFSYTWNGTEPALTSVSAPPAGAPRTVSTARINHFWITSITDADLQATAFDYDSPSAPTRVIRRRNRLGDTTYFEYDDAGALRQVSLGMSRPGNPASPITASFRAAETQSAANGTDGPTLLANVFSWHDGPRPAPTSDTTRFFVNRWGAPDSVVNAMGERTRLRREHATFPALVTSTKASTGFEQLAFYGSRALTDSTVVLNPYVDCSSNCRFTTKYKWHPKWNKPTSVASPGGARDSMFYDPDTLLLLWRQPGTLSARRVNFNYGNAMRFVSSVVVPLTNPDSVEYDGLGNVAATRSPAKHWTIFQRDIVGRDSVVQIPVDSADTTKTESGTNTRSRTRTWYDATGRVSKVRTDGTGVPPQQQLLTVENFYDLEGNLTEVWRTGSPDPANIGTIVNRFAYDAAYRKITETADDGFSDSIRYDPAGNVLRHRNRNGDSVTMEYDHLSRVTKRITWEKAIASQNIQVGSWTWTFPLYPSSIPRDTAVFVYDSTGMIEANNGDARIARAYNPNGSLRTETQRIRTYVGNDFTRHVFSLAWSYDSAGRPATSGSGMPFEYYASTGELKRIGPATPSSSFVYSYDDAGRLSQVTNPDSSIETNTYDLAGRLTRRRAWGAHYYIASPSGTPTDVIYDDTLSYDARGKVTSVRSKLDITTTTYSGMGAVTNSTRDERGLGMYTNETFTTDAFANLLTTSRPMHDPAGFTYDTLGRQRTSVSPNSADTTVYDSAGNATVLGRIEQTPTLYWIAVRTRSYYGSDNKLRIVDRRISPETQPNPHGASPHQRGAFEEYRYDALGRRVLKRSRRPDCWTFCEGTIERFVWDGDDLVQEFRYPGREGIPLDSLEVDSGVISKLDTVSGHIINPDTLRRYSPFYGVTTYVYGGVIDRPLMAQRWYYGVDSLYYGNESFILHYDTRGNVMEGTRYNGMSSVGLKIDWPSRSTLAYRNLTPHFPQSWIGSVIEQSRDASGLMYMRNRYYDPISGRFTQEDPIGLAGGTNLYGFAGGDPVNFNDPFGLCPDCEVMLAVAAVAATTDGPLPFGDVVAAGVVLGTGIVAVQYYAAQSDAWDNVKRKVRTAVGVAGISITAVVGGKVEKLVKPLADIMKARIEAIKKKEENEKETRRKKKDAGAGGDGPPDGGGGPGDPPRPPELP